MSDPSVVPMRLAQLEWAGALLGALAGTERAFAVGGCVRDLLLGYIPREVDLVVEGNSDIVAESVATALGGSVESFDRFGTATVRCDALTIDIAAARSERYPEPGALPEVEPAGIESDLRRRDFTINAIAVSLSEADAWHAVPGALDDLATGTLRVLHEGSFTDDPTRLLRLVRYAARLGFTIDPETEQLARAAVSTGALKTVSGARIGSELRLLLAEDDPMVSLLELLRLGIDAALIENFAVDAQLIDRALELLPVGGDRSLLMFACCLGDCDREALGPWLTELEFEAGERDLVLAIYDAQSIVDRLATVELPSQISEVVARLPIEAVALAGALGARKQAREWLERLSQVRLEITGDDLIAAGASEGPQIGEALSRTLAQKLDGEFSGQDAELKSALATYRALHLR